MFSMMLQNYSDVVMCLTKFKVSHNSLTLLNFTLL